MSEGFVKLFTSILDSSVWNYDAETKVVWVTLLAMSDKDGFVHAAVTGIASRAGVSVEKAEEALSVFSKPDKYSRNTEHNGRRIEQCGRDWKVLNFEYFRNHQREEAERARKREWWRKNRSKEAITRRKLDTLDENSTKTSRIAEAEADPEAEASRTPPFPTSKNTRGVVGKTVPSETLELVSPSEPAVLTPVTTIETNIKKTKRTSVNKRSARESKSGPTWEAYSWAYERRYGTAPLRNAQTSSMCSKLVDQLGASVSPAVAEYYLSTNANPYAGSGHTLALLVRDHQKMYTEWQTGNRITQSQARANDKSQGISEGWSRANERVEASKGVNDE